MVWVKGVLGAVGVLLGLLWIGQGINLLPGSFMSGKSMWAMIGLVLLVAGAWALWSSASGRSRSGPPRD